MSTILNEVFANFERFEDKQKSLEKAEIDKSQFDLLHAEAELSGEAPRFLEGSILVTAEEKDVLLEKKHPFGLETEDIVEKAHPEMVQVAEGPVLSGVVDNQNDQHQKIVNMVNKQPTGNVFHNFSFASEIQELVAIANELDCKGLYSEADLLTEVANELQSLKKKVAKKPSTAPWRRTRWQSYSNPKGRKELLREQYRNDPEAYKQQMKEIKDLQPARYKEYQEALSDGAGAVGSTAMGNAGFLATLFGPAIISRLPSIGGLFSLLSGAGAAAASSGVLAPAGIAAAVLAGLATTVSLWNGIKQEFNIDLQDLKEKVESNLKSDEDLQRKTLNSDMLKIIAQLEAAKQVLDSGTLDPKVLGENIARIKILLEQLRSKINSYVTASRGMLPDFISDFISNVNDRMDNLEESWDDYMKGLTEAAVTNANLAYSQLKEQESVSTDYGKTREEYEDEPETEEEISARVQSMQEFLLRVPDSFWDKARFKGVDALLEKGADGKLDPLTSAALDAFANYLSQDLGVSNLSGPRLEREGTGQKLRELWQIYLNPEKFME